MSDYPAKLVPGRASRDENDSLGRPPLHIHLETKLPFGKYKWETVSWVMEKDPSYLQWAYNEGIITADDWLVEEIEVAAQEQKEGGECRF